MRTLALAALAVALALPACDREMRRFQKPQSASPQPTAARQGDLQPGQAGDGLTETTGTPSFNQGNAYEMSEGKRLYRWYNCNGCHSSGGGGIGPALMDEKWIYGSAPENVYATIMEGRPNGMPSFKGRIPEEQGWQLVAYVRSMSGLAPKAARTSRSDSLGGAVKPESERATLPPKPDPKAAK